MIKAKGMRLSEFAREAWALSGETTEYKGNWHIDQMCEHLEDVTFERGPRTLCIANPPGCSTSYHVSVAWPAWAAMQGSAPLQMLTLTYNHMLSRGFARRSDRIMAECEKDPTRWDSARSRRIASSTGAMMTGLHPRIVVVDSPLDPSDDRSYTPERLEHTATFYRQVIRSRGDADRVRRVIAMPRMGSGDLIDHVERNEDDVKVLAFPMTYDANHPHINPDDPRTEDGELLWPELFTPDMVSSIRRSLLLRRSDLPRALLQQNIKPDDGNGHGRVTSPCKGSP